MAATKNESISSTTSDKSSKFKMEAQNQDLKVVVRDLFAKRGVYLKVKREMFFRILFRTLAQPGTPVSMHAGIHASKVLR
jgi:hypothetical protein